MRPLLFVLPLRFPSLIDLNCTHNCIGYSSWDTAIILHVDQPATTGHVVTTMGVTPAIALVHEMLLATLSGAHVLVHEMLLAALSGAHPLLPVAPGGALLLVLLLEMPIAATSGAHLLLPAAPGGALLLVLVHEMLLAALSGAHLLLPATPGGALILEMLGAPVLGMLDDQAATGALTIMVARQTTALRV
ncbi:hypothetical protein HBI56_020890 [Parastagonospora nodorum]|nr:hypothetical protein HBI10_007880 [Parastagonospora nodorum]KAH4023529.1 hypothetical protein HBI13_089590 [Parastagonospora nodorum]KAH4041232.1 hypothetical protein HBI09_019870 [Parastagonospora nodorum]KAH4063373.1 hypothetical protein HBH50_188920 [Parastagonospora nodorum]KAH4082890.1 hypothetical protein HBH46_219360 [Parastagonospora nodorum]